MTHDPKGIAEADIEELVAYLDGELAPDMAAAVEDRLSRDASYRAELQQLDRAWHALEELPKHAVGDGFARTTIEMAAVQAEEDLAQLTSAIPVQRRRRRWGMVAAGVAAVLGGAALARLALIRQEGPLVAGLPAIVEVDALRQFDSVDFLSRLHQAGVFDEGVLLQVADRAGAWEEISDADPLSRRAWIAALPEGDKAALWEKHSRIEGFSDADKQRLFDRERALAASPDAAALRSTALAYQAFMSQRPPSEQSALRELPVDERIARIEELTGRDEASLRQPLTLEETTRLRDAIRSLAESGALDRLPKLLKQRAAELPEDYAPAWAPERRGGDRGSDNRGPDGRGSDRGSDNRGSERGSNSRRFDVRRGMTQWAERMERSAPWRIEWLGRVSSADIAPQFLNLMLGDDAQEKVGLLKQDWQKVEATLLAALDPVTRERLEGAPADRRRQRLSGYVMDASRDRFEEELEQFFASDAVTQDERQRLLAEPTHELKEQLRELYLSRELSGLGDPGWLMGGAFRGRGEGREGPDGRGRPGGPGPGGPGMGGPGPEFGGRGGPGGPGGPPPGQREPGASSPR